MVLRSYAQKRLKCSLALTLILGLSCASHAQSSDAGPTDLQSYLEQAQAANPQLKAFEARYEAAMQRIPQASALPEPRFQITHFVESVQTRTGPQENVFMLSQTIPWFGKLGSRENAASAEAEALWYAFQSQQLMVARSVALNFYEYGFTGHAIELTEENLDLLQQLEPVVEEKVKAGGDLNALLRLKVEVGKIGDQLESLKQKRIAQSAKLNELLATAAQSTLPWPDWDRPEVIQVDGPSLIVAIETNNPELLMLERQVASAEARREIARLESFPDITLGFNYIQTGEPEVSPNTPDAGEDPWGFTVALTIPIWFKKYDAARAEALASQRANENEYDNRSNRLRAELSASVARLNDANRRLALYGDELLGLAEQAAENSRYSYENGRTGILEVIDSERSLLELQLLYWRAATDAWQQRVIIQTLANQPILGTFHATQDHE
ncbi:MAG: TolC family protein [Verrucomicrobiota bacterium]